MQRMNYAVEADVEKLDEVEDKEIEEQRYSLFDVFA